MREEHAKAKNTQTTKPINLSRNIKNMKDKEKLALIRALHGVNVMYTRGLFHTIDKNHNEIYINPLTSELDKRGLYKTLVVMDNVIVAKVTNNTSVNFVVLNKENLDCLYKTKGVIHYIDENLLCDKTKEGCTLISHNGKQLESYDKAICVNHIHGNKYVLTSDNMYQDKILFYNAKKDYIDDLTEGKSYLIHILDKDSAVVEVSSMTGVRYLYDFNKYECKNAFTNMVESETQLWKIV